MKKILILFLIILTTSLYSADLHIAYYSDTAVRYAKENGKNVILWFYDQSEKSERLEKDILSNGQLLAVTENFVWLRCKDRNIAKIYGVNAFPAVLCIDRYGDEIYGTRISYSLDDSDTNLSKIFLFALEANGLTDGISDDWYDYRYLNNRLRETPLSYWDTYHTYKTDDRNRNLYSPGNTSDFVLALLKLYQIYPSLNPIISETKYGERKIYRKYEKQNYTVNNNNTFIYNGSRGNHIYSGKHYDKNYPKRNINPSKDPKEEKKELNRTYKKNKEMLKKNNPVIYYKLYGLDDTPKFKEDRRPEVRKEEKQNRRENRPEVRKEEKQNRRENRSEVRKEEKQNRRENRSEKRKDDKNEQKNKKKK